VSAAATWRTDDPCPVCDTGVISTDNPTLLRVAQDSSFCGWSASWQADLDVLQEA
jgi:hypothetical protein